MSFYLRKQAAEYGIPLTDQMLADFVRYRDMLLEWNEVMNLTTITEPRDIDNKHFLDSLTLLKAANIPHGSKIIDIGTGAGFPGLPLKIARPDLALSLLDSLNKRIEFLGEISYLLGQENDLYHARAEEAAHLPEHREQYDLATARAVAALPILCEYCLPYVKPGGLFLAMKGPSITEELESAETALEILGGKVVNIYNLELPDGDERNIIVIEKTAATPAKYPRKYARMTKSPL